MQQFKLPPKAKSIDYNSFIVQATVITIVKSVWYSGLYYKPITIINDDSSVVNTLETSVTDDARVVIYDCHMFIVWCIV